MQSNQTSISDTDPWEESGAMVYVALTVATFSAVTMCCIWFMTKHSSVRKWFRLGKTYDTLDSSEDQIQLKPQSRSDIMPESESPRHQYKEDIEHQAIVENMANTILEETSESKDEHYTIEHSDSDDDSANEPEKDSVLPSNENIFV